MRKKQSLCTRWTINTLDWDCTLPPPGTDFPTGLMNTNSPCLWTIFLNPCDAESTYLSKRKPRSVRQMNDKYSFNWVNSSNKHCSYFLTGLKNTNCLCLWTISSNPCDAESVSKAQYRKNIWQLSKPCNVGIHWIALTEYSQTSTHVPRF